MKKLICWFAFLLPSLVFAVEQHGVGAHTFHIDGTGPEGPVEYTELDPSRLYDLVCRINSPSQPLKVIIYAKKLVQGTITIPEGNYYGVGEFTELSPNAEGKLSYVLNSVQAYGKCELTRS